jgi:CBS domain containing-hemolysin-like protein
MTFILSILFSVVTNVIEATCNEIALVLILIIVISIGIIFDLIGTSAITAKEASFHAMSSKKIKGAKEAIYLIKNSNKISSICNDVIGDICGIISGGIGVVLANSISESFGVSLVITSIIIAAFISSSTVGGKAIFKKVAIKNNTKIIKIVGRFMSIFNRG